MGNSGLTTMRNILVMVLADGKLSDQEKRHIELVRGRLGISAEQFKQLVQEVRAGGRQISLPASPAEAEQALRELIAACQADSHISPPERRALERIAEHVGLSPQVLEDMMDEASGAEEAEILDKIEAIYVNFTRWDADERRRRLAELAGHGRPAVLPLLRMLESYRGPEGAADALELKTLIIDQLAELGDRRAVYYLAHQVALSGTNEITGDALRAAAAEAIGRIAGQPFTRDAAGVEAVRRWWLGAGVQEYDTLAL